MLGKIITWPAFLVLQRIDPRANDPRLPSRSYKFLGIPAWNGSGECPQALWQTRIGEHVL